MERHRAASSLIGNGVRTHFWKAARTSPGPAAQSGEFGGCSEIYVGINIQSLAKSFHVYAPDWLELARLKSFLFEDMCGQAHQAILRRFSTPSELRKPISSEIRWRDHVDHGREN